MSTIISRIWSFRSHCSGERHQSAPDPIAWPKGGRLRRLGVGRASRFFAAGLVEDSSNAMFMECLGCRISQLILGFYGNLWGLNMSEWDLTCSKKLLSWFIMFYGVLMGCCVLRRVLTMSNTWKYSLRNSPVDGLMYRTMNWRVSVGDYELSVTNPYDTYLPTVFSGTGEGHFSWLKWWWWKQRGRSFW
jgi:hypothetical protein